MSLLLDTHVWIWSQESPRKLGPIAVRQLKDPRQELYVSTVSTLELARLLAAGIIELSGTLHSWVNETLGAMECRTIEISHEVAIGAYLLQAPFHKDPADRILVATARIHGLTLVTADARMLSYPHLQTQDARK
ncbi:MAG: type II toxin-antitoxin system VapC family toxin [Acidobacteriota bacterium]